MDAHILVLNYNGRDLLSRCLPSVVRAASKSRHRVRVSIVDNASTDGSCDFVRSCFDSVGWYDCENLGLCSYNGVLHRIHEPVAVLLNNDIELSDSCLDPLLAPLESAWMNRRNRCIATAPMCVRPGSGGYDGQQTAVRFRHGLVQATSHYTGCEQVRGAVGETAAAGAALAVDRERFLALGGFDALYLPGRLEDLDLGFRAYLAGYYFLHVPTAVSVHLGAATYGREYSASACDALTLRNTILFQWKNLRARRHVWRMRFGLGYRMAAEVACWPWTPTDRRFRVWHAMRAARERWRTLGRGERRTASNVTVKDEVAYFERFHPRTMRTSATRDASATEPIRHRTTGERILAGLSSRFDWRGTVRW